MGQHYSVTTNKYSYDNNGSYVCIDVRTCKVLILFKKIFEAVFYAIIVARAI